MPHRPPPPLKCTPKATYPLRASVPSALSVGRLPCSPVVFKCNFSRTIDHACLRSSQNLFDKPSWQVAKPRFDAKNVAPMVFFLRKKSIFVVFCGGQKSDSGATNRFFFDFISQKLSIFFSIFGQKNRTSPPTHTHTRMVPPGGRPCGGRAVCGREWGGGGSH